MSVVLTVQCAKCSREFGDRLAIAVCPECNGALAVVPASPPARGQALKQLFDSRVTAHSLRATAYEASGVWRFRELVLPGAEADVVSFPEGNTPLVASDAVARYAGVAALRLKHEGLNPTGSFKDRGMTVAITQARRVKATAVACASTGNTSASLAAYASRAGIPSLVLVPHGKVAPGKLAQTIAYGARVLLVRGDFDDCMRLVREASAKLGVYLANSLNPFRIEGQKTIIFEMLQQCAWNAPDWIAVPAGNLGNTSAFGKALVEAREFGLIDRLPRLISVQAAGAAPFAAAFDEGFVRRHRVKAETIASAIRIGDPASWDRAVAAIRETDGVVLAVGDDAILAAKRSIDAAGVGCEPASAASVAGVRELVARGIVDSSHRVVAVLTGHLLKDPMPQETGRGVGGPDPIDISPDLSEIERVIGSLGDGTLPTVPTVS
ncbi:MAG: threonine synthase [Phycisphaerales bacterium]|nr:threonine synthase [Phycisphaerales bacterium]